MTDTAPPPEADFDFASLDPANLLAPTSAPVADTPAPLEDTPPEQSAADTAIDDFIAQQTAAREETPVNPTPTAAPTPTDTPAKPEAVNMRKLRELREAAEKDRDTFKTERDSLAAKLADLEPRAKNYESERAALEARLADKEKAHAEAQAEVWRKDARARPDWQETAKKIHSTAEEIGDMLKLPAVTESGLRVNPAILLDPGNRQALNETIRVLNESGHYAEASLLMQQHLEVNKLRGSLRQIEQDTAAEAETWSKNSEAAEMDVIRRTREELAGSNPVFDTSSPTYLALPKEQQDFLSSQITAAEAAAREMRAMSRQPEAVLAASFKTNLALRLAQQGNAGLQAQMAATARELAEVKSRLATYEKAAGGGSGVSSASKPLSASDDPDELAKSLDPRNMPGYRGVM